MVLRYRGESIQAWHKREEAWRRTMARNKQRSPIRDVLAERLATGATYAAIALEFDVTRERVRQIANQMGLLSPPARKRRENARA